MKTGLGLMALVLSGFAVSCCTTKTAEKQEPAVVSEEKADGQLEILADAGKVADKVIAESQAPSASPSASSAVEVPSASPSPESVASPSPSPSKAKKAKKAKAKKAEVKAEEKK